MRVTGTIKPWLAALMSSALLLGSVQGHANTAEEAPKPEMVVDFDVPQDMGAQVVHVLTRDIPAGAQIPWHTHPGVEIAYVETGQVEISMDGKATRNLVPGESFMVPRGTVHAGRNIGAYPARLVITYVVDSGEPLRSAAATPDSH